MTIRNQKDTLAKLMAAENITVVHKKVSTASFDVKNRVLTCPILKDELTPELYDLFMGHEVGHALWTPYEGLHSTLNKNPTLKGYLNVIEDVRIERKIREKFSGLRKSFYTAYNDLLNIDFFGTEGIEMQDLALIDRINLHTKCGSKLGVEFTEVEQQFVDRSFKTETWDDVVKLAEEIYEFSKREETRTEIDDMYASSFAGSGDGFDEQDEYQDGVSFDDNITFGENQDEFMKRFDFDQEDDDFETIEGLDEGSAEVDGQEQDANGGKKGGEQARESITEYNAHNNEEMFVSDENVVNIVKDLKGVVSSDMLEDVIGYKTVFESIRTWFEIGSYEERHNTMQLAKYTAKKLVDKNKKIVNHMAKEFEMKQSAHISLHARTGKTGKLDPNKLAKHQIVEDVFKRTMMLPKGKNHGINLMLDWSGSIRDQLPDLLEQALILVMFCQKVQIPFRVYSFTNSWVNHDSPEPRMTLGSGKLVELFSNEMKPKEMKHAIEILGLNWNYWFSITQYRSKASMEEHKQWFGVEFNYHSISLPYTFELGGTPLNDCLFKMRVQLQKFNQQYKVEKSILSILTDGYSHPSTIIDLTSEENEEVWESGFRSNGFRSNCNITIIDPFSRKAYTMPSQSYDPKTSFNVTQKLIDWVASECNAIVTGFFILGSKRDFRTLKGIIYNDSYRYLTDELIAKEWREIRKSGMVIKNVDGYNKMILSIGTRASNDDGLDNTLTGEKKGKLLSAFKNQQKGKLTTRFIANEFMKEIA